jgi:Holliday junction DNA helicase RuvB
MLSNKDKEFEKVLRPASFDDFTGQAQILDNLSVFVKAAKMREEALDHVLLHGPPGLGKTTLANIIANEMGVGFKVTSGPVLDKPGDLAGLLTNLETNDVLFIDEIHRLSPIIEEYLYSAMEDYRIDIMIDNGPNARTVQINLNPFTLIGATTRSGLLTAPLRARFGINSRLEYYNADILCSIIKRAAGILKIEIHPLAAEEISRRSRGTPRIANALLRRVRDFAMVKGTGVITKEITQLALGALNVDRFGLDEMDNKILTTIISKFNGGPVGMTTIATACGEDAETIEEVYEPYLIQEGFLVRTPRGREVTELAYKHLGYIRKNKQGGLIKMIIVIIIAIAILSWYGMDIKDFFTSPQAQKNFGYVWTFLKDAWTNYLAVPAHKVWGIWLTYGWEPLLNIISNPFILKKFLYSYPFIWIFF